MNIVCEKSGRVDNSSPAGNALGDAGAFAFASALKFNHSLRELDLRDNSIGPEGGLALRLAERSMHTRCRQFDLRNNNLPWSEDRHSNWHSMSHVTYRPPGRLIFFNCKRQYFM